MTRKSIDEYLQAIRDRYLKATKEEKGNILDEFTKVTGIHRKAAIRLLNRVLRHSNPKRRGRKREYDAAVIGSLKIIWESSDRLCSKRLKPFMAEIISILGSHDELHINAETQARLCRMSTATMDRLLKPYRKTGGRRGFTTTRPGNMLKKMIPIRTFTDWQENKPGFFAASFPGQKRLGVCRGLVNIVTALFSMEVHVGVFLPGVRGAVTPIFGAEALQ